MIHGNFVPSTISLSCLFPTLLYFGINFDPQRLQPCQSQDSGLWNARQSAEFVPWKS